jgi:hypothetical protein
MSDTAIAQCDGIASQSKAIIAFIAFQGIVAHGTARRALSGDACIHTIANEAWVALTHF